MAEPSTLADITNRIAEIDAMLASATGWGSWIVGCANEREALVDRAKREFGAQIEHKWQARQSNGARTD